LLLDLTKRSAASLLLMVAIVEDLCQEIRAAVVSREGLERMRRRGPLHCARVNQRRYSDAGPIEMGGAAGFRRWRSKHSVEVGGV
jgi:hypothetical protein